MSRCYDEHCCCPKKVCHIHRTAPRGNNSLLIIVALLFLFNNNNNGSGNVNRNIIRINDGDIEAF